MSFEGNKLAGNGQMNNILMILENKNDPRCFSPPWGHIQVYIFLYQISGLQDHWSSAYFYPFKVHFHNISKCKRQWQDIGTEPLASRLYNAL